MSFDKIIKSILPAKVKEATPLVKKVRELEEVEKAEFIAFVDDGTESYDVKVTFDSDLSKIVNASCDCPGQDQLCKHVVAVILALKSGPGSEKNSLSIKKIRKKKLSPLELLMDEIDAQKLKAWLIDEISSNKQLSLKFLSAFENTQKEQSYDDVLAFRKSTFKAVLGNAKYMDSTQLKSILEIWKKYFEKNFDALILQITKNYNPKIITAYFDIAADISLRLKINSKKHLDYREEMIQKVSSQLGMQHDFQLFRFIKEIFEFEKKEKRFPHLFFRFYFSLSSKLSKQEHIELLTAALSDYEIFRSVSSERELTMLLKHVKEIGVFETLFPLFQFRYYANEYNPFLIEALTEIKEYNQALKLLDQIIKSNTYEEYNLIYYKLQLNLLKLTGQTTKEVQVLQKMYRFRPSYELYLDLFNHQGSLEEQSLFKTNALKQKLNPNSIMTEYYLNVKFGIWIADNNTDKVFENLNSLLALYACFPFVDQLYQYDKNILLTKIMNILFSRWIFYAFMDEERKKKIANFIRHQYTKNEIIEQKDKFDRSIQVALDMILNYIYG